jgi:uncharacterized repeat protein (TIGR01451 family)
MYVIRASPKSERFFERERMRHLPRLQKLMLVLLSVIWIVRPAVAEDSQSPHANTRLKRPLSIGTVQVTMTGQFVTSPTDSFLLYKRLYTGTTNCNCPTFPSTCSTAGGGPTTYVTVSPSAPDSTSLSSTDSLLLQMPPGSTRNGQQGGFSNSDGATLGTLPGYATCVSIADALTHVVKVSYTPAIQVLDASCTNPKFYFKPGDTLCVRYAGSAGTVGTPWKLWVGGGTNECDNYPGLGPLSNVTGETGTQTFVLPSSNAAIPAGCSAGNNTFDIRGYWRAMLQDNGSNTRAQDNFRLHDSNPFYDLSINSNVTSADGSGAGFPTTGNVKYQVSVQNNGPDAAPGVALTVPIPASTTFTSVKQTQGAPTFTCNPPSGGNVVCSVASMPPDNYATIEVLVHYSSLSNGTVLASTASVAANSGTDYFSTNNTNNNSVTISTATSSIYQLVCAPDINDVSTGPTGHTESVADPTCTSPCSTGGFVRSRTDGVACCSGTYPIGVTGVYFTPFNNGSACHTTVTITDGQNPDVQLTKSHTGFFSRGQSGAQWSIVVKNTGAFATNAAVTVSDIPRQNANDFSSNNIAGFTPTSLGGTGWNCDLGFFTCTRSDALASGASYPPITITGNLQRYGAGNMTNRAFVSGGGEGATGNNESDDLTSVIPPVNAAAVRGDVDGDSKADLVWRNGSTGADYLWEMNGSTLSSALAFTSVADTNWKIVGSGDFDGDGKTDLLWRNSATGDNYVWLMNGATLISATALPSIADLNWKVVAVGDFSGDGKADIFWRNSSTGSNYMWIMNGTTLSGAFLMPSVADLNWVVQGTGDFDGDGKYDLFWRNISTGGNYIWILNGSTLTSATAVTAVSDLNYNVVAVGDFDGDSKADLFWRNGSTGANYFWKMNGAALVTSTASTSVPDVNFQVVGAGDFDGDGKTDLLWRHAVSGSNYVWIMNGATYSSSTAISPVADTNWKVVSPK